MGNMDPERKSSHICLAFYLFTPKSIDCMKAKQREIEKERGMSERQKGIEKE